MTDLERGWRTAALENVPTCEVFHAGPPAVKGYCPTGDGYTRMDALNRASVADVARLFWSPHREEGVTPNEISDLYVDMCPRSWRVRDGVISDSDRCSDGPDLPLRRLQGSVFLNNLSTAYQEQLDHVQR